MSEKFIAYKENRREIEMFENTYLSEDMRLTVVKSYLLHEHKKLFHLNPNDQKEKINNAKERLGKPDLNYINDYMKTRNPVEFISSLGLKAKWELFHIVSFGIWDKKLYNCIGHPAFQWHYNENFSPFNCKFESKVGWMQEINDQQPTFIQALKFANDNKDTLKNINDTEYDKGSPEDRSKDPIIGRLYGGDKILVHDGNGRLAKIISNIIFRNSQKNEIRAFIGVEDRNIINSNNKKDYEIFKKEVFME